MEFVQSVCRKGMLLLLFEPILQDNLIHDLAAENASPSEKLFAYSVEFFENHCSAAPIALHDGPPLLNLGGLLAIFVPIMIFNKNIKELWNWRKGRMPERCCLAHKIV
jgi:hypothetical protein